MNIVAASHPELGERFLYCEGDVPLLFTENETNQRTAFRHSESNTLCQRRHQRLRRSRPPGSGQSGAERNKSRRALSAQRCRPGARPNIRLRLTDAGALDADRRAIRRDSMRYMDARRREADEFYQSITPVSAATMLQM